MSDMRSTTIIAVGRNGKVAIAGDGQVTLGSSVMKSGARKVRRLFDDKVVVGFAGAAADALSLLERLEGYLKSENGDLRRASVALAREWRMDKMLRRLEAMIIASDGKSILVISGSGDVIEPDNMVASVGSGSDPARAAATALLENTELSAREIAQKSLMVAASICIYTNDNVVLEEV